MSVNFKNVPATLRDIPHWLLWRKENVTDENPRGTKIPYNANHCGTKGSSNNPETWGIYDLVVKKCQDPKFSFDGIGFVLSKDTGITIIDLDKCTDGNTHSPLAQEILDIFGNRTYVEASHHRDGLHIILRGNIPAPFTSGKHNGIEIYDNTHFFAITGVKLNSANADVTSCQEELNQVIAKYWKDAEKAPVLVPTITDTTLSDEDIISIASHTANTEKFNRLWSGSTVDYAGDASSADMALASILAFYTTDAGQIERIMRQSGLVREKWNRKDYLSQMTITKAIKGCKAHYEDPLAGYSVDGDFMKTTKIKKKSKMIEKYIEEITDKQRDTLTDKEIEQNHKAQEAKERAAKSIMLPEFPGTTHPLFSKWMKLGSALSYSRVPFHFFALLTVLSMTLGRKVKTKLGLNALFANVFCMLIGTSSVSGKSYASQMVNDNFVGSINSWSDKLTEPRLIQKLADNNTLYWHYDECQAFFRDVEKFNGSILSRMCLIYDGLKVAAGLSTSRMDKNSQEWICEDPFMSCLFSMITDQFNIIANSELITGGFLPRWMPIIEEGGSVAKNKDTTSAQEKEIAEIQSEIKYVYEKLSEPGVDESGKVDTSKNVEISFLVCDKIEQWKIDNTNKNLGPDGINQRIAVQRAFGFAYKLAMIFSLYDKEFQKEIFDKRIYPVRIQLPDRWVDEALKITELYLLPRVVYILDKSAEENTKSTMSTIKRVIKENSGSIDRRALIRKTRILSDDIDKAIKSMKESEEISEQIETSLGVGRPRKIYCLE